MTCQYNNILLENDQLMQNTSCSIILFFQSNSIYDHFLSLRRSVQ